MGLGDYVAVPYSSLDPDGDILKDEYLDVYQMMDVRGSDVLDDLIEKGLVKANPRRGSSADKKEAFQDFLNRGGSQLVAQVPSQMPGAMGGGMGVGNAAAVFDHGIAGNMSDIQSRPIDYGVKGGPQQMPYMYGTQGPMLAQGQGGFNIMNPFTYGNMKKAVEGTRAGDENIEYADTPAGKLGEAANERNRMIQQLFQGY